MHLSRRRKQHAINGLQFILRNEAPEGSFFLLLLHLCAACLVCARKLASQLVRQRPRRIRIS